MRPFFAQTLWMLLALAALAVGASCALAGLSGMYAALAGAGLAVLDLGLLALVAAGLGRSSGLPGAGVLGLVLALKFPILAGVLYLLVVSVAVNPVGLGLGFSSLPMALVGGVLMGRLTMDLQVSNERSLG